MVKNVAGLTFEVVDVGHDKAVELLGANSHNRKLRPNRTNTYAIDMLKGNWATTGDTIKFSRNGVLLDGQHRLAAVVQATTTGATEQQEGGEDNKIDANPNLTITFAIVRGIDTGAQEAMDTGASRALQDILELNRGEKNTTTLATALRVVYAWHTGSRRTIAKRGASTNATLLDFFDQDPDAFRDLTQRVIAEYSRGEHLLSPRMLALCHWILEEIEPEEAEFFFARLSDGQNLAKGHPIYELREQLRKRRSSHEYRSVAYTLAIVIKAWNAFRNGETITGLSYKMGGKHPENFPEPM